MRRRDPRTAEDGFQRAREVAAEHVDDLILEFGRETDHGVRCWLLELIGETRSPETFGVLKSQLWSPDEALSGWAVRGLELLDTKEARRLLWQWRQNDAGEPAPGSRSPTSDHD